MALGSRNKISVSFSMASMTDIVFLLLIFFMITSTLISPNALKVLLPSSTSKTMGKQSVSVTIKSDLTYYVNAKPVEADFVEQKLIELLSGEESPGIILHADKSVPLEYAVKIMEIANKRKYQLVIATTNK
ncbi:MAG TPA: biopolymer transporter ExbD [Flavobacteriales bacterium]|nr:biopolymer transporter ExbD [Flavobacteriales bacterium]HIN38798.1 biopolymer transporter ExbD [Flavobacteriales bacterium]